MFASLLLVSVTVSPSATDRRRTTLPISIIMYHSTKGELTHLLASLYQHSNTPLCNSIQWLSTSILPMAIAQLCTMTTTSELSQSSHIDLDELPSHMLSNLVSVMQEVAHDDAYKPELVSQDNTLPSLSVSLRILKMCFTHLLRRDRLTYTPLNGIQSTYHWQFLMI